MASMVLSIGCCQILMAGSSPLRILFPLQRLALEAEKVQAAHQWREDFAVSTLFNYLN